MDLLAAAEALLAATGNAVALCPTYADPGADDFDPIPATKETDR